MTDGRCVCDDKGNYIDTLKIEYEFSEQGYCRPWPCKALYPHYLI